MYCTRRRANRAQHAMEPDIGSESRFCLYTAPAFDAPVRAVADAEGAWGMPPRSPRTVFELFDVE